MAAGVAASSLALRRPFATIRYNTSCHIFHEWNQAHVTALSESSLLPCLVHLDTFRDCQPFLT